MEKEIEGWKNMLHISQLLNSIHQANPMLKQFTVLLLNYFTCMCIHLQAKKFNLWKHIIWVNTVTVHIVLHGLLEYSIR